MSLDEDFLTEGSWSTSFNLPAAATRLCSGISPTVYRQSSKGPQPEFRIPWVGGISIAKPWIAEAWQHPLTQISELLRSEQTA
jgi:hypothetical protein